MTFDDACKKAYAVYRGRGLFRALDTGEEWIFFPDTGGYVMYGLMPARVHKLTGDIKLIARQNKEDAAWFKQVVHAETTVEVPLRKKYKGVSRKFERIPIILE